MKKIPAFLRRLGLVASGRRSDKERGEERGRERDRKGKFAFQEHGFESGCNGGNGGGCRLDTDVAVVVVTWWLAATGGGGTPPSNDFNEPPS